MKDEPRAHPFRDSVGQCRRRNPNRASSAIGPASRRTPQAANFENCCVLMQFAQAGAGL